MKKRTFFRTLVGAAVLAAFSGAAYSQQTVKIGLLATLEGPFAAGGADGMRGAELAIKQKNGMLRLANIKPQIREVFTITKLDKLFKILPTRKDALASFVQ